MKANITSAINSEFGTNYKTSNLQTSLSVKACGGSTFGSTSEQDFSSRYNTWLDSFDSSDANSVIVDYTSGGLVALWDILPSEYSSLSTAMESAYNSLCTQYKNQFCETFKTGNYKDFSGGVGDAENPYLITTADQLAKIDDFDMEADYKLKNDVSLQSYSNWSAIGGHYKEESFEGTLDGNNHTVSYLARTTDIAEKNHRIYFGLFGSIGTDGVVKNIKFTNVSIAMTGPAVNDTNTRVFVGAVAGSNSGTIQNVNVSGKVSYNCCTNGVSHVGGIVGIIKGGKVSKCTNRAEVFSGRYTATAGGIAGYINDADIIGCKNYGSIKSCGTKWYGTSICGGIVGEANTNGKINISSTTNSGAYTATDYGSGPRVYWYVGDQIGRKTELNVG